MTDISQETHTALLQKAVADATAQANAEGASLKEANATLTSERDALTTERASLLADNERLNGDLDKAQVSLKAATDEAAALKSDIAAKDEAAQKAEVAATRAAQVKNLGLFPEKYITEKASRWAEVDEASWTERLDEWKAAKGDAAPVVEKEQDAASALTGADEAARIESTNQKPNARRAVLGLA